MDNRDGIVSLPSVQGNSSLPPHVVRAAKFALRRGLPLVALCGPSCDNLSHGRKGHSSAARGKVPLGPGWAQNHIKQLADLPPETGNVGGYHRA